MLVDGVGVGLVPLGDAVEQGRDRGLKVGLGKLDRVERVEGEPPNGQPTLLWGEQQPQRARILHVGGPAACAEQSLAPLGGHAPRLPPPGVVWVIDDALGAEWQPRSGPVVALRQIM